MLSYELMRDDGVLIVRPQSALEAADFETLAKEDINIEMISTSEIKISCIIKKELGKKAVQLLHQAFGLDKVA